MFLAQVCVVPDESGNPITSQGVLPVLTNEDGLAYIEWQLLRLVYCASSEVFTGNIYIYIYIYKYRVAKTHRMPYLVDHFLQSSH